MANYSIMTFLGVYIMHVSSTMCSILINLVRFIISNHLILGIDIIFPMQLRALLTSTVTIYVNSIRTMIL